MPARLTGDEVRKVALLGRLKVAPESVDQLASQLGRVLEYVDVLSEVDTEGIEPMAHPIEVANVFRDDAERPSLPRDAALSNAPKTDGRCFVVPAILDQE